MHTAESQLLAGTLDNLMRYLLTGCPQAAARTAILLERQEAKPDMDAGLGIAARRLRDMLAQEPSASLVRGTGR